MSFIKKTPCTYQRVTGIIVLSLLSLPSVAAAAITYQRSPSGVSVTSPIAVTVSVDSFEDFGFSPEKNRWQILLDDIYNPQSACFPSTQLSATIVFNLPVDDVARGVQAVGYTDECYNNDEPYDLEGNGSSVIFTVVASPPPESAGGGTLSYRPDVEILQPKGSELFSSEATITYRSSDQNDLGAEEPDTRPFGLSLTPVSLFYSDKILEWDHTIIPSEDKTLIVDKLPASGSYDWHITGLTAGSLYRIIVNAIDKVGELGEAVSDFFTIDLTPSTFLVSIDPPVVRLGNVHISVDASEDLKEPPRVMVTQRGSEAVLVAMTGATEAAVIDAIATSSLAQSTASTTVAIETTAPKQSARHFDGVYEVVPGFDGTAFITVSGVDRAGNVGTTILSGSSFNVGVEPPPAPHILSPLNKATFTTEEIVIKGTAREDTDVLLSVNGVPTATMKPGASGVFVFDKVTLNKRLPHGENTLSVATRDQTGNTGAAVILNVSVNGSPTATIDTPLAGSVLSGTSTVLRAKANDPNNDPVVLKYEILPRSLLRDATTGNEDWTALGETLSGKLSFDTTAFSDGEYLLRVIASDSATTTTSQSRSVVIKNQLPLIKFTDGRRTISRGGKVTISGTVSAPNLPGRPTMMQFEYSSDGLEWFDVPAQDGTYNAVEERFALSLTKRSEGSSELLWRATDSYGRSVVTKHFIVVDTTAPVAPVVLSLEHNGVVSSTIDEDRKRDGLQMTLSGKAEARSTVTLKVAGRTHSTEASFDGNWRQSIEIKDTGVYTILMTATDAAGNTSGTRTVRFTYDNVPEVVFINPREGRGLHGLSTVDWFVKDPDGDTIVHTTLSYRRGNASFIVLSTDPKESSFVWDTGKLSAGNNYTLKLEVSDGFATTSAVLPIAIDNNPPTLSLFTVSRKAFGQRGVLSISGSATDDLSGVEFVEYALFHDDETDTKKIWLKAKIVSGFLSSTASFVLTEQLTLSDGVYRLFVRAVDAAGNTSSAKEERISVDSTSPSFGSLVLSYRKGPLFPQNGEFVVPVNVPLALALALEGDTDKANINVDGSLLPLKKDQASGLWTTELLLARIGTTTINVSATDLSGNVGEKKTIATIRVVLPGSVMYEAEGNVLPAAEKSVRVLVADPSGNTFSNWNTDSSAYGAPIDIGDGKYILALPRGTYRLVVSSDGLDTQTTDTLVLDEAQFVTQDMVLMKKQGFWSMIKVWLQKTLRLKT